MVIVVVVVVVIVTVLSRLTFSTRLFTHLTPDSHGKTRYSLRGSLVFFSQMSTLYLLVLPVVTVNHPYLVSTIRRTSQDLTFICCFVVGLRVCWKFLRRLATHISDSKVWCMYVLYDKCSKIMHDLKGPSIDDTLSIFLATKQPLNDSRSVTPPKFVLMFKRLWGE